ncbi:hypothetical protein Clacol_010390 [Clathrus columnatus]|uniref:Uncharacterized protein n=1 Tax=Clathrus columnatus TaxID=1419009 RepID=A0AAV5AN88_9AGAM|nr:hypothetical protein Clacol_010390 [Clathrus columnatus]
MSGFNSFLTNEQRTSKGAFIPPKFEETDRNNPELEAKELQDENFLSQRLSEAQERGRQERTKLLRGERHDPTQEAHMHGNEPSRGAVIDRDLAQADRDYLKNKGKI